MSEKLKHFTLLNIATACIATSGFLGKLATKSLSVESTLFWRCLFGILFLIVIVLFKKESFRIGSTKEYVTIAFSGLLFYGHLYFYFEAIDVSSVAIAVISMFTFPIMTALIEPFLNESKHSIFTLFSALLLLLGLYMIVPSIDWNSSSYGIILGLLSALCYTIRNLISKKKVSSISSNVLMSYQIGICTFLFLLTGTLNGDVSHVNSNNLYILILLGLIPTAIGHNLFMHSFKYFTASTASIITSLQPVVAILYAYIFVNEIPTSGVMLGGGMIILAVLIENLKTAIRPKGYTSSSN